MDLSIGELARRTGMKASAVRYYEARGILPPSRRRANGYRIYGDEAIGSLRFVRRAQALGIRLAEIRQLLDIARQGEAPCARVRDMTRQHLREVEGRIRELERLRAQLRQVLRRKAGPRRAGRICAILEEED
jgi:DNA-binding transcriptional MerR regulator